MKMAPGKAGRRTWVVAALLLAAWSSSGATGQQQTGALPPDLVTGQLSISLTDPTETEMADPSAGVDFSGMAKGRREKRCGRL